ncbi:MAG: HAMP domain-containing protein [Deltaproteobacteria bacterium]|nr:HAMP domain-containing protein [Deltaproteobacteria bacterium]
MRAPRVARFPAFGFKSPSASESLSRLRMKIAAVHSLAFKITLLALVGTGTVLCSVIAYSYFVSKQLVTRDAGRTAKIHARSIASNLDQEIRAVVEVTECFASALEEVRIDRQALMALIRRQVELQEGIFGCAVAFEPYTFDPNVKDFAPYYFRGGKGLEFVQLGADSYNYPERDWYREPVDRRTPIWTKPYFDKGGGNVIMTTYSQPFFHLRPEGGRGSVRGVVTADVSVGWLTRRLASVKVLQTGFCFLVSGDGTFVAHPDQQFIMNESLFTLADKLARPILGSIGEAMLKQQTGFIDAGESLSREPSFLAFARLPTNGWSLGVVYPKQELFADIVGLHRTNLLMGIAGLLLLLGVSLLLARAVANPLRRMVKATSQVAHGDLNVDLSSIRSRDEVGLLAEAFTGMTRDLKKYIHDLTETTAAKERIESELAVAARIQRSMLPSELPAFGDGRNLDLFAVMYPAKEVGGDFYDFGRVDEERLYFAVGDVSGKGVPAALFMATSLSLLRTAALEGLPPDQLLTRLNRELSRENEACMFVTIFCGVLNMKTGDLIYARGGHEPAFILTEDRGLVELNEAAAPLLGLAPDLVYPGAHIEFRPGDILFAYTDGVTEATNAGGEIFSSGKLREKLTHARKGTARDLIEHVGNEVTAFAQEATQADDITMLSLVFKPGNSYPAPTGSAEGRQDYA